MPFLTTKEYCQYFLFVFFVLDIFFMGSGVNYSIMGLGTRKLIFAAYFSISISIYFDRCTQKLFSTVIQVVCFIIFFFVWVIFLPVLRQGSVENSLADALPLMAVAIFLLTDDFSSRERGWISIRWLILYLVVIFSLLHVFLYGASWLRPDLMSGFSEVLKLFWEPRDSEVDYFVFLTSLDNGLLRVYFGSSFLLLLGLYFSLSNVDVRIHRWWSKPLIFLVVVSALWATNTRSLLFGLGVFLVSFLVSNFIFKKLSISVIGIFFLVVAPFFLSFLLIPTVDPQILSVVGITREGSDDLRAEQLAPLLRGFFENPVFGQGFGGSVEIIRSEDSPYSYELSIFALFMKLGVLGFIVISFILSVAISSSIPDDVNIFKNNIAPLYALYFSYVLSCFYNPYMFGFFGTFFSLFLLYEFAFLMRVCRDD